MQDGQSSKQYQKHNRYILPRPSGDRMTQTVLVVQSRHIMLITTKPESQEHSGSLLDVTTYHALVHNQSIELYIREVPG